MKWHKRNEALRHFSSPQARERGSLALGGVAGQQGDKCPSDSILCRGIGAARSRLSFATEN